MKNSIVLSIMLCCIVPQFGQAQINILNRAKQKIDNRIYKEIDKKIDEKVDEVADKIFDKTIKSVINPYGDIKEISDEENNAVVYTPQKEVAYDFGVTLNNDTIYKLVPSKWVNLIDSELKFRDMSKEEMEKYSDMSKEEAALLYEQKQNKETFSEAKKKRLDEINTWFKEKDEQYKTDPGEPTGKRTLSLSFETGDSTKRIMSFFAYFDGQLGQQKIIHPTTAHPFSWFGGDAYIGGDLHQLMKGWIKTCAYMGSKLYLTKIDKTDAGHYSISGAFEMNFHCPNFKYSFTKGVFKNVVVEDFNVVQPSQALQRQRILQKGFISLISVQR